MFGFLKITFQNSRIFSEIMKKSLLYFASIFVCISGLQNSGDKFHYFKNNGDAVYKYQYYNWDPSVKLPNTSINNYIIQENGYVEDFNGTPLIAAAVWRYELNAQYTFKEVDGVTVFNDGWMFNLLSDLSYMLNFTIKAIKSDDYTVDYENGTLVGPGGLIVAGEADLMVGLQYVTDKMQALRPIHPLGAYRISAFLLQPKVGGGRDIYTQPFRPTAWLVIIVIVAGLAVSTLICCATEKKYFHESYDLEDSIAWICGIFLSQSYYDAETLPVRIIFVAALSLALVLSNSYCAFIISSLATEYNPITTPQDLEKFKYRVVADPRNSYTCDAIYSSSKNRQKYCGASLYKSEEDAVQKLYRNRRGKFAFVKSLDLISVTAKSLQYSEEEICSVTGIILPFKKPLTSMYGLRKSPLTSILNPKLLKIHERGINPRYNKIFAWKTNVICSPTKFTYDPDVEVADVYLAFCVLLFGVVFSCLLCLIERWFLRMAQRKKDNSNNENVKVIVKTTYEINYTNWATKTQYSIPIAIN